MHMKPPSPEDVLSAAPVKTVDKLTETIGSMTEKQQKYALERITNPDGTVIEAAKKAGYSLTKAAKASKISAVNEAQVRKLLNSSGLSLRKLLKMLKQEVEATRTITAKVKTVEIAPDGFKTVSEKFITRELPDHLIRIKAIDLALRLHGAYAAMKVNVKNDNQHTFSLNGVPIEELKKLRDQRRQVIDTEATNVA